MHASQPHLSRGTPPNPVRRILDPLVAPDTWAATWFLLSTLFVGVWWFTLVTLLAVVGFATLILAIGVPLLLAAIAVARTAADLERGRVRTIGVDLPTPERRGRGSTGGWARLRRDLGDPDTHRSLGYVLLLLVLGPIWFSLTVTAWSIPLSLLATPIMVGLGFHPTASSEAGGWEIVIGDMTQALSVAALGAVLLPLAPRIVCRVARAHAGLAERLLDPTVGRTGR